jgi:hypothetical protein
MKHGEGMAAGSVRKAAPADYPPDTKAKEEEKELSPREWWSQTKGVEVSKEPETLARTRIQLKEAVSHLSEEAQLRLVRENGVEGERSAMLAAEKEYLDAYREYHTENGKAKQFIKGKLGIGDAAKVASLKDAYNKARQTYGNALSRSAHERGIER